MWRGNPGTNKPKVRRTGLLRALAKTVVGSTLNAVFIAMMVVGGIISDTCVTITTMILAVNFLSNICNSNVIPIFNFQFSIFN